MPFSLNNRILLTGGTGSFGKAFIAGVLSRFPDIRRLVVYSRDELKQWELQQQFPEDQYPQLLFSRCSRRDRLRRALEGIEPVHAVALKRKPLNITQWNSLIQTFWVLKILFRLVLILMLSG